ncbi:glycerol kinase [Bacillus mesophilus]|uniref:ATP:glycerol 3-phosphotransferase n=1 Tax=Bacillus mesophilus TaxID=1808955 RepID=A0A6M0QE27_9BACI|nr:glycerol kinase GlpK [Bacillus mesophilus]MBM7662868.1 glycerol kinase [Bacillus mesophilus]NEY73458.1 glycerol kinase GlpK [Bacillus mesophilus]
MENYLLTIDQGTTGTKVMLFTKNKDVMAHHYVKHTQYYPKPGWVEHDPVEIWEKVKEGVRGVLEKTRIQPNQIAGIGLGNQGETILAWNAETGIPLYNAVVWSCRRSETIATNWLQQEGWNERIKQKTGLIIDSYFSATKIEWLLEEAPQVKQLLEASPSALRFGTLDTWLIANMTNFSSYVTDHSTAARTLLFNIHSQDWDDELLQFVDVDRSYLPTIQPTVSEFGWTDPEVFCGIHAPIRVSIVDQPAALYGHQCFEKGDAKCTYGTGCFVYMNIGEDCLTDANDSLLKSVVWSKNGKTTFASDGSIFSAGSVLEWAMDSLSLFQNMEQLQKLSNSWMEKEVEIDDNLIFVPSLSGIGAPHWNADARGLFLGFTHSTGKEEMIKAILQGIAHRVVDVVEAIQESTHINISTLKVDGGLVVNPYLMQMQADLLGVPVVVPDVSETTSLGLALLLGEACEWWEMDEMLPEGQLTTYQPRLEEVKRKQYRNEWKRTLQLLNEYYQ